MSRKIKIDMMYMDTNNFLKPETYSKHGNELSLASNSASWAVRQTDIADTRLNWHQNQSSENINNNKNLAHQVTD